MQIKIENTETHRCEGTFTVETEEQAAALLVGMGYRVRLREVYGYPVDIIASPAAMVIDLSTSVITARHISR